jgi:hypothetical protein
MSCPIHGEVWCTCPQPADFKRELEKAKARGKELKEKILEATAEQAERNKHPYWLSVFGAFVATQVQEKLTSGRGAPDEDDMDRYIEEAETVADMAIDAVKRARKL